MPQPNREEQLIDLLHGYITNVHRLTWVLIRDTLNNQHCSTCQTALNGGK